MKIKIIVLSVMMAVIIMSLASCGSHTDENEVKRIVEDLVTASYELNDIYFGKGLTFDPEGESTLKDYYPAAESVKYKSTADIKAATEAVFTKEYCDILYEAAFSGFSSYAYSDDEDSSLSVNGKVLARYIDDYDILHVYGEITPVIEKMREYDFDSMTIKKNTESFIDVIVPSMIDGKKDMDIKLSLRNTENGWRLDSPTY